MQRASLAVHRGVVLGKQGRLDEAVVCLRGAIDLKPDYPEAHFHLGIALGLQRRLDEAVVCLRRAIELKPDYPHAHSNLGAALQTQGLLDEAVVCLRAALGLRPDSPEVHVDLGNALRKRGLLVEAVACFRRAIDLKPDFAVAYSSLGDALSEQGRLDEAIACFRRAIDLKPDLADAHSNLGIALEAQGLLDGAIVCFRRVVELKPDFAVAHSNLGVALEGTGRLDEAIVCFRKAIELKPDLADTHSNLGVALQAQGLLDEAVACFRRAIELKPDLANAHGNLGVVLEAQGLLDESVACFRRAIRLKPGYPEAHLNWALTLLAEGDLAAGWDEAEWRWKTQQAAKGFRNFAQPQWRGEAAEGRSLLIHAEQGFGDTLQFCRYAPLAAARGLRVTMEVQEPLARLLRSLSGVDRLVVRGDELPPFDLHCPMLSMPLALGTTLATIPSAASYLHADASQVAAWRERMAAMPRQGPRIGVAWAGNPALKTDRRRSLPPERLAPLLDLSELHFFSLQKDGPAAPENFPLTDFMDEMRDFADTAALIANLDLVVSVDTAVAHLAAALGKQVWMLDRFDSDWRWLRERRDSPWYPTLRLYRQPRPGDWDTVLADVARDLRILTKA